MPRFAKIFLVGYTGCGKTTLGRSAAKRLRVGFADTDSVIESEERASVADIFRYEGEEHFRYAERAVAERLSSEDGDMIISTGGGLPVWRDNAEFLKASGTSVYIRRSAERIAARLTPYGRAKRPRLRGLSDDELIAFMERDIAAREPFYANAHYTLDGDSCSDKELVEKIVTIFDNIKKSSSEQ